MSRLRQANDLAGEKSSSISKEDLAQAKKLFESYLKVTALAAIHDATRKEIERNVWMLDSAGFTQTQIENILDIDQSTVSRILTGKATKRKGKKQGSYK